MSDPLGSPRRSIARLVFVETLIPVGVAAAAGLAAAAIVPPHWRAAGLPYWLGYGKNVESAAIAAALAAGASTQLFVRSRRGLGACALPAALGFAFAAARCPLGPLLAGWPQLLAIAALAAVLGMGASGSARVPAAAPSTGRAPALLDATIVAALALAVFTVTVGPALMTIDVFHQGEVLTTAVDLLRGGRPFETLIWPHGLHDTGLAALWIRATGKIGTSAIALAQDTCCALGVVSVYVLARRLVGSRPAALAACLAAALAPLLLAQDQGEAAVSALHELGNLVFVALACAAIAAPRSRLFAAGIWCALAHLFRLEAGVYATLAALAVLAYRELAGGDTAGAGPDAAAASRLGAAVLRFLAGIALVLVAARLLLGWPGAAWFAYTLRDLPRYHRDAVGIPFPWPHRGAALAPVQSVELTIALSRLLLALLLLVQAVRAVLEGRRKRRAGEPRDPAWEAALLFVALFAALGVKSGLDRSDLGHLLQWTAFPLLAAACLALGAWSARQAWSPRRTAAAAFVLLLVLDFGWLGLHLPSLRGPRKLAAAALARRQALAEHLGPNPPAGACADRMFTRTEIGLGVNRRFVDDECAVEALLRSHGVHRLVAADSAPWYDVRFLLTPASRYYALARAYTPALQLDFVAALRARPAQALLLPRGYGSIKDFDLPDAIRVPVAEAYLTARRQGVAATPTSLGDLFFWNDPGTCPPATNPGATPLATQLPPRLAAPQGSTGPGEDHPPHPLGTLSGAEWHGLDAAIAHAAALGRADRLRWACPRQPLSAAP